MELLFSILSKDFKFNRNEALYDAIQNSLTLANTNIEH